MALGSGQVAPPALAPGQLPPSLGSEEGAPAQSLRGPETGRPTKQSISQKTRREEDGSSHRLRHRQELRRIVSQAQPAVWGSSPFCPLSAAFQVTLRTSPPGSWSQATGQVWMGPRCSLPGARPLGRADTGYIWLTHQPACCPVSSGERWS